MRQQRICLFFSDTGGGHRSATEAIEAGLKEMAAQQGNGSRLKVVLDNIVEKSHPFNRCMVNLYNYLLRHHQSKMKYYHWMIQSLQPNNSRLNYLLVAGYLKELVGVSHPQVIVSVHPMINHYLANCLKELGLSHRVKLITVITDPNEYLWTGWACKDADLIIAPNDLAYRRLTAWGIDPGRIKVIGMPVHPDFLHPPSVSRSEFLSQLKLKENLPTICINSGWAGGGSMLEIYEALSSVARPHQVIFLCGHNPELFLQAKQKAENSSVPTAVVPFYERMPDLMSHCDLMITKAGGLTTFEAIARHLPMAIDLVTDAMPQEKGTAEMLIGQKLASPIYHPDDIVSIVESFTPIYNRMNHSLPAAHSLDRTDAIYDIAHTILAACDPQFDSINEVFPARSQEGIMAREVWGFEGPMA